MPEDANPAEAIRMEVRGLMLDPRSNAPIVVLRDTDSRILLPIWIGLFEANAIALLAEGVRTPRPLTHELLAAAIEALGARVRRVLIHDLVDNTFYARIELVGKDEAEDMEHPVEVDARPSDAIALALRVGADIEVLPEVLAKAEAVDLTLQVADEERLRKWLEEVDPEELGKYEM